MAEKIYKSIFRMDYKMGYKILDKLGEYTEDIENQVSEEPFSKGKGNINLLEHSLTYKGQVSDNDGFNITLNPKTFNFVIEFKNGKEIDALHRCPLLKVIDRLISKLQSDHGHKYERIGFRSYIIIQNENLEFEKVRDYIWGANSVFGDAILAHFNNRDDIGITFEAKTNENENMRVRLGPYKDEEYGKYFTLENDVKQGFILDIDVWEMKKAVPDFSLVKLSSYYQEVYQSLSGKITANIKGELIK